MDYLSTLDYGIIAVYFLILVGMGLYLRKRASTGLEGYFLANKKLPWWMLGVTGMGWSLDVTGTMLIISLLYLIGPRGLFIEFRGGANLSLIFMMIWTGKWHRRSNCMTGAEWMTYRFGDSLGGHFARVTFALSQIIFAIGMLAYMVKGVGLFLATFTDRFTPFECALIMVGVATLYTITSGFYGVVFSDLFQCALILVGIVYVSLTAVSHVGDGHTFINLAETVSGVKEWGTVFPQLHAHMPRGYEAYDALLTFTLFLVIKNIVSGFGSGFEPHYFAARNERECGKLTALWACLMTSRWPMMMGFAVLGLFLVADKFPDQAVLQDAEIAIKRDLVQEADPALNIPFEELAAVSSIAPKSDWPELASQGAAAQAATPEVIAQFTARYGADWPATLAALLEQEQTVRSIIPKPRWHNTLATIAATRPQLAGQLAGQLGDEWEKKLKLISYEGTVDGERILPAVLLFTIPAGIRGLILVTLIAASMSTFDMTVNRAGAFFTRDVYQKFIRPRAGRIELLVAIYTFTISLVTAAFVMAYTSENINDIWGWIMMGLWSGLSGPILLRLYWWRFNGAGFATGMIAGVGGAVLQRMYWPELAEEWQFVTFTLVSVVFAVAGTYISGPTNRTVLEHFYRTTRPFGAWGPLRHILSADQRRAMHREQRNDMIAIPFALVWIVTMFLIPIELITHRHRALVPTAILFVIALVGMYKYWYRNLPPATNPDDDAPAQEVDA